VKRIAAPDTPVPFSPPLEKAFIPQVEGVAKELKELIEY
jgi:pyruvate/2-oxoglutarate/acetoin dehydrogenase E1 component